MAVARRGTLPTGATALAVLYTCLLFSESVQALNSTAVNTTSLLSIVDYSPDHVTYSGDLVAIKIDPASGSRVRSVGHYAYGVFSAKIKCPAGDTTGLVPTFYTSSLEGSDNKDELDFEFLGKNKSVVQSNYWVNGVGSHESVHELGFDCSKAFHDYSIDWTALAVRWFIDGRLVRTHVNTGNISDYPTKPAYAYASIWDCGNGGKDWNGLATYADSPYLYELANVTVNSPGTSPGPASAAAPVPAHRPVSSPGIATGPASATAPAPAHSPGIASGATSATAPAPARSPVGNPVGSARLPRSSKPSPRRKLLG